MFALDAWFSPAPLKRGIVPWKLDRRKLAASAIGKSESDLAKARKLFDTDRKAANKKLFHAVRVPMFARQIATTGRLHDYGEANEVWAEILANEGDWDALAAVLALRTRVIEAL